MQPNGNAALAEKIFAPARFGILLALLIFAAFPQVICGLETFVARDYGFFAYPLAHFQKECFWRGELPLWNPYNNCGVPFLAQWNTMPLYPLSLIYLLLPLDWSLSFFSLFHLWLAGLGMYFLARRWTANPAAAALAGTVFSFNGFTLNLLMWPSHIATFGWMPWLALFAEAAWREGGRKIPVAAMIGALQMLAGGPETIFLTWLIISALWLQQFLASTPLRAAMLWRYPLLVILVFALSAAQLLPFLDLVAHAQRETGYTDLRWSMPAFGLASFLVPMAFGTTHTEGIFFQRGQYWTSSYYLGLGTIWLALLGIDNLKTTWRKAGDAPANSAVPRWKKFCGDRRLLLTFVSVIALLCALGENTPFYPLVRKLVPQLSFITYPVKFVMVFVFAAPLLAAFALANFDAIRRKLLPLGVILLAAIAGIVLWTQTHSVEGDDARIAMLNGISRGVFLLLTAAALFAMTREAATPLLRFAPLALVLTVWLDVFTHEPPQNPTVTPRVYELNLARARLAMDPQPELGGARAMLSPAAALELTRFAVSDAKTNFLAKRLAYCANVNLLDAVPKVDGFFSLAPREFDLLLSTIYNASNGEWSRLQDFMGVSQYTAPSNVLEWRPRTTFHPLVSAGQRPVFLDDTNAIWAFGRNEVDPAAMVILPPDARPLVAVSNHVHAVISNARFGGSTVDFQVTAESDTLAVVAQTCYHNWQAEVDGKPALLFRANAAFQALRVPAGAHSVHLFYRDRAFEIGAALAGFAWLGCVVAGLALPRRP